MSTRGQFNTKSPTIRRILREASELASAPSPDFTASPLEDNLFEWHFTLRGPPSPSPYSSGIYHGRIVLPSAYPLRPPSFRFLTPTGRFEVNREICLSISGHHEETWQPAWGIRTALVAIRSFMDSPARGQVGGVDADEGVRRRLAEGSRGWRCGVCGGTNEEILREREGVVEKGKREEEKVPEELRLAYRDELEEGRKDDGEEIKRREEPVVGATGSASTSSQAPPMDQSPQAPGAATVQPNTVPTPTVPTRTVPVTTQANQPVPAWIDKAIMGVVLALIFMILKKVAA